ncbi:unnamed protein product [Prorocentrum cordatum]|uniref:Uncharacterized protein n=1 Tax=Prorocentrum cordatum TaxID=2364126 RepID=A0ABN9TVQ0_9DINO|nr:unnamed protein product [Polarella glacialis]
MIYAARGSLLLPDAADTEKGSGERREQGETPALSRQPSMRPAAPKGLGQGHERPESSREVGSAIEIHRNRTELNRRSRNEPCRDPAGLPPRAHGLVSA